MKKLIPFLLVFVLLQSRAQNILLNFSGSGAATAIDSVRIQNLKQCASVKILGNDTLKLSNPTLLKSLIENNYKKLYVFPNPTEQNSVFEFDSPENGPVFIDIFNAAGKRIHRSEFYVLKGTNKFQVDNLPFGLNLVVLYSDNFALSEKIASHYQGNEKAAIQFKEGEHHSTKGMRMAQTMASILMPYNPGERLLIKAYAGNFTSVKTIVPTADSELEIPFIACSDLENNHYATVQIGTQVWMAENLKVSKYRNGDTILTNLGDALWSTSTSGAYAIYNNDQANNSTRGKLYNWYALTDSRGLCPAGWHAPSDDEWKTLESFLGMPASELDQGGERGLSQNVGGKLKSVCSSWASPNTGASNESGFSAIAGGLRANSGLFNFGNQGFWWSSSENSNFTDFVWSRFLNYSFGTSTRNFYEKRTGLSVRCIRD